MDKTNIFTEAEQRMLLEKEPIDQDWFLFRKLYNTRPFLTRKKRRLYKHLERHLYDHDYTKFNEEERHTFRIMLRLEEASRNRLYGAVSLSIIILATLFARTFF